MSTSSVCIDRRLCHCSSHCFSDGRGSAVAELAAEDRLSHDVDCYVRYHHDGLLYTDGDNAAEEGEGRLQAYGNNTGIKSTRVGKLEGSRKRELEPGA